MPGVAAPSSNPENAHAELAFNVPPGVPSPFGPPLPLPVISPALGAVKHSIITGCWHMLTTGELYREAGGDYFTRRDPERTTRRLVAQLEPLGHRVTLEAAAA